MKVMYTSPLLPYGRHIVKVRVTGRTNGDAAYINADKLEVYVSEGNQS
jgi:hypothetical protein